MTSIAHRNSPSAGGYGYVSRLSAPSEPPEEMPLLDDWWALRAAREVRAGARPQLLTSAGNILTYKLITAGRCLSPEDWIEIRPCIHGLEEVRGFHLESASQSEQGVEGDIPRACLDPGNEGRFPAGSACEFFLGQAQGVPAITDR